MIKAFFEPIPTNLLKSNKNDSFIQNISCFNKNFPDLEKTDVAIIGLGKNANLIRKHLYHYSFQFNGLEIADFGNLKSKNTEKNINDGIVEVLNILKQHNIITIFIGESDISINESLVKSIDFQKIDHALVAPFIQFDKKSLNYQLFKKKKHFHSSFIATQTYLNSLDTFQDMNGLFFENVKLGVIRSQINLCEPLLRQADVFEFDTRSIKASEFQSSLMPLPNGLFNQEACAICRYAGISNSIMYYHISHFKLIDEQETDQMQVAQMVWYILNGIESRFNDHPSLNNRNFTIYKCQGENDEEMVFINSLISDRWWMQIPQINNKKKLPPKFIGCTQEDFELANEGRVPEKWYRSAIL